MLCCLELHISILQDSAFTHAGLAAAVTTWRYCVGTLAMQATMIRQKTAEQATSMKLSAIARVKACCLTCRARTVAAFSAAAARPTECGVSPAVSSERRCLVAA